MRSRCVRDIRSPFATAWGEVRSARKSGWYRASLPQASQAAQSTAASHSSREKRGLLACYPAFERNGSVHHHCRHRTHTVRLPFLAHLLRRAAALNHLAAARRNRLFYQPQSVVAKRATRGENFDLSFSGHSNSPPSFGFRALHSLAATLVEYFAREFAKQLSILLLFAAARLYFFAGENAYHR